MGMPGMSAGAMLASPARPTSMLLMPMGNGMPTLASRPSNSMRLLPWHQANMIQHQHLPNRNGRKHMTPRAACTCTILSLARQGGHKPQARVSDVDGRVYISLPQASPGLIDSQYA